MSDDAQLVNSERAAITDPNNDIFVSAASAWEISLKRALGKLDAPQDLTQAIATTGFEELPITFAHASRVAELPMHHRDPFDRMLIAQTQVEGLLLVTHDDEIKRYAVPCLSV